VAGDQILIEINGPRRPIEVTVDTKARAAYVRVRFGTIHQTLEHAPGVMLDVDAEGRLLGFEMLLPCSAQGIQDVADYYIQKAGADADDQVPDAMRRAASLLQAVA
jgi:uncharacterized protein YuzE